MKNLIPQLLGNYLNALSFIAPSLAARHGFRLFCYPMRPVLRSYHKDFLIPAVNSTLNVNGHQVKIYKWGTGDKKILFVHGWQSHSFRWKNYVENFDHQEFTIFAIDAPGHGLSGGSFLTVPLYSQAIEQLIEQTGPIDTIIGHSLGAFTTLYTLNQNQDLPVKKIVLLASPGDASEFVDFYKSSLKLSDRTIDLIKVHFQKVIGSPVGFFSATRFAETVKQRALIIHDEEDDETKHIHSHNIHSKLNDTELIITKGLGHNLKSAAIVEAVTNFVKKVPEQAAMHVAY